MFGVLEEQAFQTQHSSINTLYKLYNTYYGWTRLYSTLLCACSYEKVYMIIKLKPFLLPFMWWTTCCQFTEHPYQMTKRLHMTIFEHVKSCTWHFWPTTIICVQLHKLWLFERNFNALTVCTYKFYSMPGCWSHKVELQLTVLSMY